MLLLDPSALREGDHCAICGLADLRLLRVYQLRGLDWRSPAEAVLCHQHAMPLVDLATVTADGAVIPPSRRELDEFWKARRGARNKVIGEDRRGAGDRRISRRNGWDRRRFVR